MVKCVTLVVEISCGYGEYYNVLYVRPFNVRWLSLNWTHEFLVVASMLSLKSEPAEDSLSKSPQACQPELDYWDVSLLVLFIANVHNALLGLLWHTSRKPLQKRWREKPLSYVAHYIIMIQVCESVQS